MERFPDVDSYLRASTGWRAEIEHLRPILVATGLDEQVKWGKPCYVHDGTNIAIVQEMKQFLALMFFDGALIDDPEGLLESQGPNSRSARRVCFRSVDDVDRCADSVRGFVAQAIAIAEAGLKVDEPAPELSVPELEMRLAEDADLDAGFARLTQGRQREYRMHFADAKRSETRVARVDKYADRIRAGKGMRDR